MLTKILRHNHIHNRSRRELLVMDVLDDRSGISVPEGQFARRLGPKAYVCNVALASDAWSDVHANLLPFA